MGSTRARCRLKLGCRERSFCKGICHKDDYYKGVCHKDLTSISFALRLSPQGFFLRHKDLTLPQGFTSATRSHRKDLILPQRFTFAPRSRCKDLSSLQSQLGQGFDFITRIYICYKVSPQGLDFIAKIYLCHKVLP